MARSRTPPSSPKRRTYRTGETLPAVTTDWRPIPLGRDENGDHDGQVRALAVLLRNRSDSAVYIREGPDSDDAFEISPGEDYRIWESNGVNTVSLKGENGGENVEVRTLEAHNDFDLTDRIDAFARSIAHFIQTATSNTTISGQDIDLSIDDAGGIAITGTVDVGNDLTIGDITGQSTTLDVDAGDVTIGDITGQTTTLDTSVIGDVTIGDITGQTATLDTSVTGDVTIGDITGQTATLNTQVDSGNVVIDDVTATSANFDGDITGQTDFELSVRDIEGKPNHRVLTDSGLDAGEIDSNFNEYVGNYETWTLFSSASHDGFITSYSVRVYDSTSGTDIRSLGAWLELDDGSGWDTVVPSIASCPEAAYKYGANSEVVSVEYLADSEAVYRFEPRAPIKFREGEGVRFNIGPNTDFGSPTLDSYSIDIEVTYIERVANTT